MSPHMRINPVWPLSKYRHWTWGEVQWDSSFPRRNIIIAAVLLAQLGLDALSGFFQMLGFSQLLWVCDITGEGWFLLLCISELVVSSENMHDDIKKWNQLQRSQVGWTEVKQCATGSVRQQHDRAPTRAELRCHLSHLIRPPTMPHLGEEPSGSHVKKHSHQIVIQ